MPPGARDQDIVCAISTPPGVGGISTIRISGENSYRAVAKLALFLPESPLSHQIYYGHLRSSQNKVIDEVMISYFQKGRSFTGEETLEISCHGSPTITRLILRELVMSGARLADRGEFTFRAFMNGRLDLVQAEGVLSLIESQSELSARQALRHLSGEISSKLQKIEDSLIWCLANIEAAIDFSTEDIEGISDRLLEKRFIDIKSGIEELVSSYESGRYLKEGLKLALVGEPNVGKSSLLNLLAEDERAIVAETAGTTRDTVEAEFLVEGIKVIAVDTAGLRETQDKVEKIGIERAYRTIDEADIVFFVFDLSRGLSKTEVSLIKKIPDKKLFLIGNKKDLANETQLNVQKIHDLFTISKSRLHFISTLDKRSAETVKKALVAEIEVSGLEDQAVISVARHFENLSQAKRNLENAAELLKDQAGNEFLAIEMKEALILVQETLGKRFDDQIMDRVFKEFCIGK